MVHTLLYKKSTALTVGIITSSLFCLLNAHDDLNRKSHFDIKDKNIGFFSTPTPNYSTCWLNHAVTGSTTTIYRNSVMSPSIAVNPHDKNVIVAAWEQDVTSTSGAGLDIGIGYSTNGGKNWHQTVIPFEGCNGGFIQSIDSAWLSYGPNDKVYLIAAPINSSLDTNTLNQSGIVTSVSPDNGQTWSNPHFLTASQNFVNEGTLSFPLNQKPSITADPLIANKAYAVWSNFPQASSFHSNAALSITNNGGVTWSPHAILYDPFNDTTLESMSNGVYNNVSVNNNIIVVLPNGDLLNFMVRKYATPDTADFQFINDQWPYQFTSFDIAVVRSTDGGLTWQTNATQIAAFDGNSTFTNGYVYNGNVIFAGLGAQIATEGSNKLFNVNINPNNGNLYVVWQSGQFTENQLPQIALSSSRDGGLTWSAPVMVSRTPVNSPNPQAFTPAVAIGKHNHVGILYHDFRKDSNTDRNNTQTNVWFAHYKETTNPNGGSTGAGLDFVKELRISQDSYIMQNGPMVKDQYATNGDYNSIIARGNNFYALYVKSNKGPFVQPTVLSDNPETATVLLRDNNKRTAPFFSKINTKK